MSRPEADEGRLSLTVAMFEPGHIDGERGAEFPSLLDMFLDHVKDRFRLLEARPGMDPAIEGERIGLDVRIAEIRIGAGAVALQELADFEPVRSIEEDHFRRDPHRMGVARRLVGGDPVDEHFGAFARHLYEILAFVAFDLHHPVLIHQAADQRAVERRAVPPLRDAADRGLDVLLVRGGAVADPALHAHAILLSCSPKRGARTAIRQRRNRQLANL